MKNYQALAMAMGMGEHRDALIDRVMCTAPSGSGIDCGTEFCENQSSINKLVFTFSYHCINDNGYYDGWFHDLTLVVRPSLRFDIEIKISGFSVDKRLYKKYWELLKDYLYETYDYWLNEKVNLKEVIK